MVASVMTWKATTSVLMPNPIIAIARRTSHSRCLNKPPTHTAVNDECATIGCRTDKQTNRLVDRNTSHHCCVVV